MAPTPLFAAAGPASGFRALKTRDYYLIVGRLIPDNNADLLVEGYLAANSGKKLVIVGDVPYKDAYADRLKSKASSNIIFLGYVTNSEILAELYHHCFAYLHGHEFGGTNPTMLKAMAYGLPYWPWIPFSTGKCWMMAVMDCFFRKPRYPLLI
jgi:glycosyltransferase involved in cell wall biosynthesis